MRSRNGRWRACRATVCTSSAITRRARNRQSRHTPPVGHPSLRGDSRRRGLNPLWRGNYTVVGASLLAFTGRRSPASRVLQPITDPGTSYKYGRVGYGIVTFTPAKAIAIALHQRCPHSLLPGDPAPRNSHRFPVTSLPELGSRDAIYERVPALTSGATQDPQSPVLLTGPRPLFGASAPRNSRHHAHLTPCAHSRRRYAAFALPRHGTPDCRTHGASPADAPHSCS
jgi:hypothetical protein